ncbi:deoxyguanosinetriphosphate triphosphohydrolase [Aeromonas enteropelogenes]|uniref:dGTPase n=1 Tax=Aeromonas enteropelogenes TaxID=29489 RepID=UPI002B2DBF4B|nr:deoxyguanosinetriphosphate triphosphohydrolase [Aeromonas enteropelogenes]BEE20584.1 deoxyguanosinetriphosphate triphosphohydrolase [Aeromonas enteropelogenes]
MYRRLITPERIHPWGDEELLEATEQDRARIVQAAPVRRLQQKTQVFPLDVKASVRSRLTHSLEVQETGRQISRHILAALPTGMVCEGAFINLVEMSCLLHDVGNPPFGHFGEQVMSQWLGEMLDPLYQQALGLTPSSQWAELRQDLLLFDGNAQSLRLVHSLHELNLTLGQLAALCKYPQQPQAGVSYGQHHGWSSKRGIFFSEQPLYRALGQSLGLAQGCRHPLVYIMEAADDISYCIADLEDAVDRRILTLGELLTALRSADGSDYLSGLLDDALASGRGFFPHFRQQLTRDLVALAAKSYVDEHDAILRGSYPQALLHGQAPAARVLDMLKQVARELVFRRPEVEALELEGYAALRGVLSTYSCLLAMPAGQFARLLAGEGGNELFFARRLYHRLSARHLKAYRLAVATRDARFTDEGEQEWYYRVRLLLDYVSGMTDTYVLEEYRLLSGI